MKKMKFANGITFILLLFFSGLFAQETATQLPEGNEAYKEKKYAKAEANYRVAASKNKKKSAVATYNLGTSIYKQKQPGEAKFKFVS